MVLCMNDCFQYVFLLNLDNNILLNIGKVWIYLFSS